MASPPVPDTALASRLSAIDSLLAEAGAVRTPRRRSPAGSVRPAKPEKTLAAELERRCPLRIEPHPAENGVLTLRAPGWNRLSWLWHGFSTRVGGNSRAYADDAGQGQLNLGFTKEDPAETVAENRRLLVEAVTGSAENPLITIRQVHSNIVVVAGRAATGAVKPAKADGILTDESGILIGVQTADCVPVLVADRKRRAVGAFHAGWRGTVARIVENGIGRMRMEFGSRPEDMVAAIGPGIGQCCYSVGEEVLAQFESQFAYAAELFIEVEDADAVKAKYPMLFLNQRAPGHGPKASRLHLDLVEANRRQLLAAGLGSRSIQLTGGCTSCRTDLFFSHRASGGRAGRMLSVIGVASTRAGRES